MNRARAKVGKMKTTLINRGLAPALTVQTMNHILLRKQMALPYRGYGFDAIRYNDDALLMKYKP